MGKIGEVVSGLALLGGSGGGIGGAVRAQELVDLGRDGSSVSEMPFLPGFISPASFA